MLLVKLAQENSLMCGPFCANISVVELEEKIKTKKFLPSLFGNFTSYR